MVVPKLEALNLFAEVSMENMNLLRELCFIYDERNVLQRKRRTSRHKLYRAKIKFNKKRCAANKLLVLQSEAELLDLRIAIAEHVAANHKRVLFLTKKLHCKASRSADNEVRWIRMCDEYVGRINLERYAKEHITQIAVENMLAARDDDDLKLLDPVDNR